MGHLHTPGWGSLALLVVLILIAAFIVTVVPENLATWDNPSATVLPAERTMPKWANWCVGAVMIASIGALVMGWLERRSSGTRIEFVWHATAWVTTIGLLGWALILVVSQVDALNTDGAPLSVGVGVLQDGVFAIAALLTAGLIARDLIASRSRRAVPAR